MANPISFRKMHGSGNDFILIDNRDGRIRAPEAPEMARRCCKRKFGVGADGLILIENSLTADFKWRFYNADGSEAEMCGNGGRCAARFAVMEGIAAHELTFETIAGLIQATVKGSSVKLQLPHAGDLRLDVPVALPAGTPSVQCLNTGVPHAVIFTEDIENAPVSEWGRLVRNHPVFQPAGTNVNFVKVDEPHTIRIRTYERGVEDETLACGTGAVASSILSACKGMTESPVKVRTRGGEVITVYFALRDDRVKDVFMEGETVHAYSGRLDGDLQTCGPAVRK